MSAASNAFESAILRHVLMNEAIPGVGDSSGLPASATAGNVYASLHTADPGEAGNQGTSEASYTGYARVAIPRGAAGWNEANGTASNAADVNWPAATGGNVTATHVVIGTSATGAGMILARLPFANPASLNITAGVAPKFAAGKISISVD